MKISTIIHKMPSDSSKYETDDAADDSDEKYQSFIVQNLHDFGAEIYTQKSWDIIFALRCFCESFLDWLQSLKQVFINVSYHILVASLTMMALF